MTLTKGQRNKVLQKYAHLIGGVDENGVDHKLGNTDQERQARRSKELFAVLDTEKEHPMWEFVTGERATDFIMSGRYEVEYLGKNRDLLANGKVKAKMKEQEKQHVAAMKAKHERQGLFNPPEYYESLLNTKLEALNKRFDEYTQSNKEETS